MDQLWAAWRFDYVSDVSAKEVSQTDSRDGHGGCVFCGILASNESEKSRHVVHVGKKVFAVLNAYPYASGHLLILPMRHVGSLDELDADESIELWETTRDGVSALRTAYGPDGVNIGANLGRAAGAGIPGHLHMHILPRWSGDTNFMTAVASVRVLPEALDDSWGKITTAWPSAIASGST